MTHREAVGQPEVELAFITIDCRDAEAMLAFWSEALGWEIRRATYTTLRPPNPATPGLFFQEVEEPTPGKNRLHMDLVSRDRAATVKGLLFGGDIYRGPASSREPCPDGSVDL